MRSKRLLLHVCCGPCAILPAESLAAEGFEVVLWFMNPNIQPLAEYLRRREGVAQVAERLGMPVEFDDEVWDLRAWLNWQLPHANLPDRCIRCCCQRLEAARNKAGELDCDFFSTSLLYSRYQPHEAMAAKGRQTGQSGGPEFVYRDFRQFWQEGIDRSIAWGIYRQPYCGCVFSEAERYAKKFARLKK